MAVPLMRNAFAEKRPDLFVVFSKTTEIFALLSITSRLQKRELNFWETITDHDQSLANFHLVFSYPLIPQKPLFPSSTQSLRRLKLAVHVDFSSWNSSERRFFKQDQVANLGQIVFSNSCQLSHFWIT